MKGAGFVSVIASIYICAVYTTVYSFLKQAPKRFNINGVLRILSKNITCFPSADLEVQLVQLNNCDGVYSNY